MKSETKEKLSGDAYTKIDKSTGVTIIEAKLKNVFGQTIVRDCAGIVETYIIITKNLIVKSTRNPSVLKLI